MDILSKLKFMSLYRMVLADGKIAPAEIIQLKAIGINHYGLTDEVINKLLLEETDEMPPIESDTDKIKFLYEMSMIAWSDNELDPNEKKLLQDYAKYFGVNEENLDIVVDFLLDCAKSRMTVNEVMNQFN